MAFCRMAQYRPELAGTFHDFTGMLEEQNGEGGKAKTATMHNEALQISTDLSIRPLLGLVLSKHDILKA